MKNKCWCSPIAIIRQNNQLRKGAHILNIQQTNENRLTFWKRRIEIIISPADMEFLLIFGFLFLFSLNSEFNMCVKDFGFCCGFIGNRHVQYFNILWFGFKRLDLICLAFISIAVPFVDVYTKKRERGREWEIERVLIWSNWNRINKSAERHQYLDTMRKTYAFFVLICL